MILRVLESLAADMQLTLAKIDSAKHALAALDVPSARVERPARCQGVMPEACALTDGEWSRGRATLGNPSLVHCRGCGHAQEVADGE